MEKFKPNYLITSQIAKSLARIEAVKAQVPLLPLNPIVLASLRETARLYTTHYSTMIEGNRLNPDQIKHVIKHDGHFPGRKRDEHEVKGYYEALAKVEKWAAQSTPLTEKVIQTLHGLVMGDGSEKIKPTPYRDGQNVIRDGKSGQIIYLPPEAKDVPPLMHPLIIWIEKNKNIIPAPIMAGIAHYQFATIHPYYDGNGRTARLLTTMILQMQGYGLKGLYNLEEYYARNLAAYYDAISIGPSHNYYEGRAEADITAWIEYFVDGVAESFEKVLIQMKIAAAQDIPDQSSLIRALDPKQRKALELFQEFSTVTAAQIGELFGFKQQTNTQLCKKWVEAGFLEIANPSNRARSYRLAKQYEELIRKFRT